MCPQEVPGSDPGASNFLVIHLSAVTGDFFADFRKNKKSALSTLGRRSTFLIFQKKVRISQDQYRDLWNSYKQNLDFEKIASSETFEALPVH